MINAVQILIHPGIFSTHILDNIDFIRGLKGLGQELFVSFVLNIHLTPVIIICNE